MTRNRLFAAGFALVLQFLFIGPSLFAQSMLYLKSAEEKPLDTLGQRNSKGESLFHFMGDTDLYSGDVYWYLKLERDAEWELYAGTYKIEKETNVVTIRWWADHERKPSDNFEIAKLSARKEKSHFDYSVQKSNGGRINTTEHLVAVSYSGVPAWAKDGVNELLLRKYKSKEVEQMLRDHENWKIKLYSDLLK